MELFEAIAKRHSYRGGFKPEPVSRDDLRRIVQAGIQAPSGCNAQTTSFVIVDDPETMHPIADLLAPRTVVSEAAALIACVVDHRPVYQGKSFAVEDCAAAVENMLLAITGLGYASVWLDGVLRAENRATRIAELLGVPADLELRILLPVGLPAEPGDQKEKQPFDKRAWFNRYGD